ncbi:MAG: hypothetical protein KF721_03130 [Ignavibacteriaceae bacterium]|nr:hypothetical protein [Ignavibacteriaceae bacterium]
MTTLASPSTLEFSADSIEKQVYNIVEKFSEFIPVINDRNRLGYALFKFVKGEGDAPYITVRNAKLSLKGISEKKLAELIETELTSIKK